MSERPEDAADGIFDHDTPDPSPVVEVERPAAPTESNPIPAPVAEPPETASPEPLAADPPEPLVPAEPESAASPAHAEGELAIPPGIRVFGGPPNGTKRSVGIAVSRFNGDITTRLLDGALAELAAAGVAPEAIEVMPVPGAFELPLAAMALAKSRRYSCVLALGCVIRGETPHFDFVSSEAASGVQLAGLETGVPVSFGVLTCDTAEQAADRAGGTRGNKGVEAARSALEMVESLGLLRATVSA